MPSSTRVASATPTRYDRQAPFLEPIAKQQERAERGFYRALAALEKLQKIRRETSAALPAEKTPEVPAPAPSRRNRLIPTMS